MTGEQFEKWLDEMRFVFKRAKSQAQCARLLGVSPNTVVTFKSEGTKDRRTDLACAALLHNLKPYGEE